MKRRGELSMEVIIIAAIALLVLVILTILIIRSGSNTAIATGCTSPSIGGTCIDSGSSCDEGSIPSGNNCGEGMKCCVPLKTG
jgi:uncharacterized protein (UPF0333 family)